MPSAEYSTGSLANQEVAGKYKKRSTAVVQYYWYLTANW
jgi:hypothetical protein